MKSHRARLALLSCAFVVLGGCGAPSAPPAAQAPAARDALERAEFNRLAVRRNLPLYWVADANGNRAVDADEVVALQFYEPAPPYDGNLDAAYRALLDAKSAPAPDASAPDGERRTLVRQELDGGRATLVRTSVKSFTPAEQSFVRNMLQVASLVDALYAVQNGSAALAARLPADVESRSLFRRSRGPTCEVPATAKLPACSAIPGAPHPVVDVYPPSISGVAQDDPKFCEALRASSQDANVLAPFTVVREQGGKLVGLPYSAHYTQQAAAIAAALEAAARDLDGAGEAPLVKYLGAAANAFRTNDWWPADEAWAAMSVDNSKWYVRVGPDETYWEPCSLKAGFHLTVARINQGSREWQAKLATVQQEMEAGVAGLAGVPYRARKVAFHLPDFIDIVINAGDDRDPIGATVGQSLPNVGPVAKESRGRTVAMVNLYTDADSAVAARAAAESLLDAASLGSYADDPFPGQLRTILHEATHNLGPAQEYAVGGKPLRQILGGPIDQMMEELKAQTGALYLVAMLRAKGIIDEQLALQVYTADVTWALSQTAQGMYSEPGHKRRTYPQLAAIQLGFLLEQGAITWDANATAANGRDKGAFHIDLAKFPAAGAGLMKLVAGIKARGDLAGAEALAAKYVDGNVVPHAAIVERYARQPRASMVYALE